MEMILSNRLFKFSVEENGLIFDGESLRIFSKPKNGEPLRIPVRSSVEIESLIQTKTTLRTLSLNLTNQCNLACNYCYAKHGAYDLPDITMEFKTAVRAINLVYESMNRAGSGENVFTLAFFGGEPSLEFELIKKIVNHVEETIPSHLSVRYLLSTNGTKLTPDQVRFMEKYKFLVTLSIDGTEEAHDAGRRTQKGKGTYAAVVAAFHGLPEEVAVRARITASSVNHNMFESVKHVRTLGFKSITFAPDSGMDEKSYESFLSSLSPLSSFYLDEIRAGRYFDITNITEIMTMIALRRKKKSHCNAGLSYLSVSADGRLYRCPRFTGNRDFCLGEVSNITLNDIEKSISSFRSLLGNNVSERLKECSDCPFAYLCGGICYHEAHSSSGNDLSFNLQECRYRKEIIVASLKLLCEMSAKERTMLFDYLDSLWRKETCLSKIDEFQLGLSSETLEAIKYSSMLAMCEGGAEGTSG